MSSPSPLPSGSPETVRILHVDDEPGFADLAATFLQREDDRFRVETATSASEGLGRLADEQFDCVVSDYNMPGRDGIEFLRAVRDEYPDLPFILFTGKGSEEVASRAISAGVTDYLQKESGEQYEILSNRVRNAVERRRADRERERMRERMELALEVTESIIFEIDPDTEDLRSHGAVEEVFDEPTGDTESRADFLERAVHPEDRDRLRELFGRLQRGEVDYDVVDYRTNPAVGTQCWMRSHVYYEDSDGSRIVGLARDVTEQKARERRLRELNERFEHLAEAVPQGLFIVAADYSEVPYVNSAAEELYGVEGEELSEDPTSWQRHVHPEDRDRLREDVETQGSGDVEGPQHQEFRIQHPERGTRWLSVDLYPIRENGEVDRLAGVATDITERRERETELMRYERIVEDTDDVATVVAPDGTITYVSPSVRRTLGYDPEELIGEEGFPNQPQTTADAVADAVDDVVEHPGDSRTIRTKFERKDGSVCRVEATLRNRLDDDAIEGILVSIREVTERRSHQEQLQRQNDRLEEFASVVSHDLQNPLNVAEGRLELAREKYDSEHLDVAADAHDRMNALIDDLLMLARGGDCAGETEPVALAELFENCWQNVETADAVVRPSIDRTVRANRSRLAQLLENLIRNAVEHGGENVTVTIGALDDGFYVEDDGPGIPEDERDDVFDAGYSTSEDGTGFGLPIVERVAEAYGWALRATEGTAGGARFEITGVEFVDERQ